MTLETGSTLQSYPDQAVTPEAGAFPLVQAEFASALRTWAVELRPKTEVCQPLISLRVALDQIRIAIELSEKQIEIPLASHLAIFGGDTERKDFASSISGGKNNLLPNNSRSGATLRKSIDKELEFKIDETNLNNKEVIELLRELREAVPELSIILIAKQNSENLSDLPNYYIRINLEGTETGVETLDSRFQLARLQERVRLGLPANADQTCVEIESQAVSYAEDFRRLLHARHDQLQKDPLSLKSTFLISQEESSLRLHEDRSYFSHLHLDKAALVFAATFASTTMGITTAFGYGIDHSWTGFTVGLIISSIALFVMDFDSQLPILRATDPIDTIKSPSLRKLITEIRELGYHPTFDEEKGKPGWLKLVVLK